MTANEGFAGGVRVSTGQGVIWGLKLEAVGCKAEMLRGSGLDLGPVHPRSKVPPVVPLSKSRSATNEPLDGVTRDRGECGSEPGCGISIGSGNVDGNGTAAVLPS